MTREEIVAAQPVWTTFLRGPSTRGEASRPTRNPECRSRRLLLESLEDRLVPSLAEGTILAGTGAVIGIDPNPGQQTLVAKGGFINGPNAAVFLNGLLYVANAGDSSGTVHHIVQIDPNTGQQRLITDGSRGGFTVPVGMVWA